MVGLRGASHLGGKEREAQLELLSEGWKKLWRPEINFIIIDKIFLKKNNMTKNTGKLAYPTLDLLLTVHFK